MKNFKVNLNQFESINNSYGCCQLTLVYLFTISNLVYSYFLVDFRITLYLIINFEHLCCQLCHRILSKYKLEYLFTPQKRLGPKKSTLSLPRDKVTAPRIAIFLIIEQKYFRSFPIYFRSFLIELIFD